MEQWPSVRVLAGVGMTDSAEPIGLWATRLIGLSV